MKVGPVDKLTEKQRECLRLVLRHYTSKEMARELGIGVDAVDQRLKSAMKRLGAATRLEAARMLAAHEGLDRQDELPAKEPQVGTVKRRVRLWLSRLGLLLPRTRRGRFVLVACLLAFLFGGVELGLPIDLYLRDRNVAAFHHPVRGHITSVEIDRKSVEALGLAPWPRRYYTEIFRRLDEMGAAKIVCWARLDRHMDPAEDRAFARQLQSMSGRVTLVFDVEGDLSTGKRVLPLPEFRARAALAHSTAWGVLWTVRWIPYEVAAGGRPYASAVEELANAGGRFRGSSRLRRAMGFPEENFPIDYSIDARTIRSISAVDVLRGSVPKSAIAGKTVSLAVGYPGSSIQLFAPGIGEIRKPLIFIVAAETLIQGVPTEIPWTIAFVPAVVLVVVAGLRRSPLFSAVGLSLGIAALLLLPSLLFPHKIYIDVAPALFLLLLVGSVFTWVFLRRRASRERSATAA